VTTDHAPRVVVMGVSGCGKSTAGSLLAARLGVPFLDADTLHPAANIAKMAAGAPLTDDDRGPWLAAVAAELAAAPAGVVVACSALRRRYRDVLRAGAPGTAFLHLAGTRALLADRMAARPGHFMPVSLLDTQLATLEPLEPDEPGLVADVADAPAVIVAAASDWVRRALVAP
jgi:carbohydrate kinase (thermoresistant glucokinase family)